MKQLMLVIGALCWVIVGCGAVINTYQSHEKVAATKQVNVVTTVESQLTSDQQKLQTEQTNVSTLQGDKSQLCGTITTAQTELAKQKITLPTPAACQ